MLFTGTSNTDAILLAPYGTPAATQARAYPDLGCPSTITCEPYSLPSINELSLLFPFNNSANLGYTNIGLGGFMPAFYWSSSEFGTNFAGVFNFNSGVVVLASKVGSPLRVRPVRTFTY